MTVVAEQMHDNPTAGFVMNRELLLLSEDRPQDGWAQICRNFWPGWKKWYLSKGKMAATGKEAKHAVRRYMPELERMIDRLCEVAPDDEHLHDFLTFWCPPRYLANCSQVASSDAHGPFLIRNYDLDPTLNELTLLRSAWRGKKVIGMVDGLSGLSDGINEHGLAVSLSFGGRLAVGRGFGVPLIIRYVLEVCTDIQDAIEVLRYLPCHMSYNVTLTDRSGKIVTAFIAPDRPPMFRSQNWATNHQLGVELSGHGRFSATLERADILQHTMSAGPADAETLKHIFLSKPVFATRYGDGFGTVFTSLYRPETCSVDLLFSNGSAGHWTVDDTLNSIISLQFDDHGSHIQ
ncbi:hypothetical protein HW561_16655 [Rhodobacteraceae bacterium B1Z28]|uniref:Peptidase C45 hydrolase domain-containing protein n=1 Tax=Ruegeria haliotis TaxID=2747601 RepID=A0ABX2PTD0_9RHOB|nr:C45 family peptidase [Ruegeria haliotis]NVO57428.1 hypothetical protein [Ruegeria haliotis]